MDEQELLIEFEENEPQDGPDLFGVVPSDVVEKEPAPIPQPVSTPRRVVERQTEAPLALYRRYRPDNFSDVIGQEHVTEPLTRALTNHRINHAYLFSGPRGCGKTSSARILARCLNCEQGPTANPCGVCQSCRELATGGPGSIDVIEMDAASHGGVNEARDLRERAFFAPVNSRYKIYIIDEAHMVTKEGFNALLKVVEEPPAHVKFIFATTEPEKVIGTIRSRTHHYPFHLVPPKTLSHFLAKICESEGVSVEDGVLGLVTRAGAGSVRDCLSVLDQLLGSADEQGVRYETAAGLLGFTPDTLLDEISDAFSARDAKGVFDTIDKVIEVGQDPRRFAEDLLQRFRDLMIVAQVPDALSSGLLDVSQDQGERLRKQADGFEAADLTRAASAIAQGLTEMRGTTAPRLHLELMCSRVLVPTGDSGDAGLQTRVETLERIVATGASQSGLSDGFERPANAPEPSRSVNSGRGSSARARAEEQAGVQALGEAAVELTKEQREQRRPAEQPATQQRPAEQSATQQRPAPRASSAGEQRPAQPGPSAPAPRPAETQPSNSAASSVAGVDLEQLRKLWPAALERVKERRRFAWMLLSQNVRVFDFAENVLTLEFSNPGAKESFQSSGSNEVLVDALKEVVGYVVRIVSQLPGDAVAQKQPTADAGSLAPQTSEDDFDPAESGISKNDVDLMDATDPLELLKAEFSAEVISAEEDTD